MPIFKQSEAGTPAQSHACEHGISSATLSKSGMHVALLPRLRELEDENRRVKDAGR